MSRLRFFRPALVACLCLLLTAPIAAPVAHASPDAVVALRDLHPLRTTVVFGHRYLKQRALESVRAQLRAIGRERGFGVAWTRGQSDWDAAEAALAAPLLARIERDWTSMQWLADPWAEMLAVDYRDGEVDALVGHFETPVGRKQARIIDQTVAFHVMGAFSMAGKVVTPYPGVEAEQQALTEVYAVEDREMRFSVAGTDNIDAQTFALSPLGARYQKTMIIKLTGLLNARLAAVDAALVADARAAAAQAGPFADRFAQGARG
ncbi:MAG: hypothetical protein MUF30_09220 [Burkholderiales bacterium]|jgi:hypothetical protein|nr:hypothetical protein [Burkholderiales bacterium]